MPGVRTSRSTRTTRRPRRTQAKKVSPAVRKYVRRVMLKTEMKQAWAHHNEVQLSTLAQGYQSLGVCQVGQGTASNNRIGNIIRAKGIHIKGAFNNNSTSESFVRALIIGYPATNGDPTLNLFKNLPTNTSTGVSSVNGLDAMYYPINKTELHVYWDQVFRLAGSATGNSGANCKFFSHFVKLNGRKIEYKSTGSGFSNQNWMYSVIFIAADANDDTSTGTAVELSALERFYWIDP